MMKKSETTVTPTKHKLSRIPKVYIGKRTPWLRRNSDIETIIVFWKIDIVIQANKVPKNTSIYDSAKSSMNL
jgi:hypothetical protein